MEDNLPTIELPTSVPLMEAVKAFFKQNEWNYAVHETEPMLQMRYQGDNGDWLCAARVREDIGQFIFYSILPMSAPPKKRVAVAEFLTRVNFNLMVGNFEMDFADGEILLRTYGLTTGGRSLPVDVIGSLIFSNVFMMDKYLPGIMAVISLNVSPEEALRQIMEQRPTPTAPPAPLASATPAEAAAASATPAPAAPAPAG